jgi:DNA polymerase elongation subunit (family B)
MKFYTSVNRKGNTLYERGYEDGKPFQRQIAYKPYLFVSAPEARSPYRTIHGEVVSKIEFESMTDAFGYIKRYKNVAGHSIYGITDFEFLYIYDNYPKGFEFQFPLINIVNIDIESDSSDGFPDIKTANKEINAITLAKRGHTITLGFHPYESTEKNQYIQCRNEIDLLQRLVRILESDFWRPDILTGWNIELFDVPYVVNRVRRVLGETWVKRLSPFGLLEAKEIIQKTGKLAQSYMIYGIAIIDYYAAYKKFAMSERESYKLDFIAEYELKEKKVDFRALGYADLDDLYKRNPQLYYEYNIKDAVLIEKLENKLHYIEQVVNIAYVERVNFENTLSTVKPWDIIIHNKLLSENIVVPQFDPQETDYTIDGGYVREPEHGIHRNVVCVDFTSLYPSLAMQYNISPDTFVKQMPFKKASVERWFNKIMNDDQSAMAAELKRRDLSMTANGCMFKRDKRGFIPALMKEFFDERKRVRKLEAEAKAIYEKTQSDEDRNKYLGYKNLQTAYKLINNSGYGAIANKYFRWFANYLGEAITLSGQMTTKYVEKYVNEFLNKYFGTTDKVYVIYCDTDSAYITLEALNTTDISKVVEFSEKTLCPYIDKVCAELADRFNAYEFKTSMKLEKICDIVFFIRKKRYALNVVWEEGLFYDKPKLKVTGLETVRSSVPKKCRDALEQCFKLIFKNDRAGLIEFVNKFREEFHTFTFEEIGKPSSVNGMTEYYDPRTLYKKGCPIHVRGSLIFNEFIKRKGLTNKYQLIQDHDKIRVCYLRLPNPTHENVIAIKDEIPVELNVAEFIDYELQYNKSFLEPLRTICEVVGFDVKKQYTLEEFYGED